MSSPNPITIGVIGGSGLYKMPGLENLHEVSMTTPFGEPSDAFIVGTVEDVEVAFLPRHGRGHVHMPSEVPYRANIYALKKLGIRHIISVNACGSLREHVRPGDVVTPDQLFDFTKSRTSTFFGDGLVAHISAAEPFCPTLSALLADAVEAQGGTVHRTGTFITIEGPRFSTKAESNAYRAWGMDIIGMTTSPEAFLAREAGICYGALAHITDYDVWHASEASVTVEMVVQQLNENVQLMQQTIRQIIPQLAVIQEEPEGACECANALDNAVITDPDRVPAATQEKLHYIVEL
jgi:5'-methylthioadenosine phosphorylase